MLRFRSHMAGRITIVLALLIVVCTRHCLAADPPQADEKSSAAADSKTKADKKNEKKTAAAKPAETKSVSVAKLGKRVLDSIVVVQTMDQDGKAHGLGTGFVISSDGLIATNYHVIGGARPISVRFRDKREFDVTAVYATERTMDLAILRIDKKGLSALELGDSDAIDAGSDVAAIGHPRGQEYTLVTGTMAGRIQNDGIPMLQLDMSIDVGNSGGPVFDMSGRVQGIVSLKSTIRSKLAYAVSINALKPLLKHSHPIPMAQWLRISALDSNEWTPLFGSNWRRRADRILVDGSGNGIGRRSLCLSTTLPPKPPFEVAVYVKLENESGAAGIVFHSDGNEKHYGFYPSAGNLRFSRFDGPDVYSWKVVKEVSSAHYKRGEWNRLKVRVESDRIRCFVNDYLVIESRDAVYKKGNIGLAQFRGTEAEFKAFEVAEKIPSRRPTSETLEKLNKLVVDLSAGRPAKAEVVAKLARDETTRTDTLRASAELLEAQAKRLRQLALAVHHEKTQKQLADVLSKDEKDVDLLHAALLLAQLDDDELNIGVYRRVFTSLSNELNALVTKDMEERERLKILDKFFFQQLGFFGSRLQYYVRANSYVNDAIDDRKGLPITLSLLYIEMARRIDLKVVGIGLPGHFVVRFEPKKGKSRLIDVFERGKPMTAEQATEHVKNWSNDRLKGDALKERMKEFLQPYSKKSIIIRMLRNLRNVAVNQNDAESVFRYADTIVQIEPDAVAFRGERIDAEVRTHRFEDAIADIDWMIKKNPEGLDVGRIRQIRKKLESTIQQETELQEKDP